MANNKSIQILRGSTTYDPFTSEEVLLDGQPFYSKKTNKLYVGDGTNKISNLKYIGQEINERIVKDPSKTYLVWKGNSFPNSTNATFKAPARCTIDWGDGVVETFETARTEVNTHTYSDGIEYHLISLSNYTVVGESAFDGCSELTSVTIGNGVTSIGAKVFSGCTQLTNVTIPDSVTSIGNYAFKNCSGLTSVIIGIGVTSIGEWAFYGCSGLTSVTIPNSVTSIGTRAFWGCSGLTSVTIPNSVTSIEDGTFSGCIGLTSAIIGNGVTSIGNYAFKNCSGLTSITIPDSVTNIENGAFQNCSGLTSVTILNCVTTLDGKKGIGDEAFVQCSKLKTIKIPSTTPPSPLGSSVFDSSVEKIIVPKSAINKYKSAAGWSTYADKIVYETDSSEYENTFWLSGGVLIQPNTDLNTLTTVGNYYYPSDGKNIVNVPLGTYGPFTLKVSSVPDGSNFLIQQQFTQCNNGDTYTRVRKTDGNWESIGSALGSYGSGWSVTYNTITAAIIDFTRKEAKALLNLKDEYAGPIIVPVKALIQCAVNHYSTRACLRVGGVGGTLETNPSYFGIQIEGLPVMDDFLVHIDIKSYNSDAWITLEKTNKTYQCFYNSNYYAKTINGQPNPLYDARPKWIYVPSSGYRDTAVKYKEDANGNKTYTDIVDGHPVNTDTMPIPTGNIGSASQPVYLADGRLTACSEKVGGTNQPIWMNDGTLQPCSGPVGSANQPIWMNNGVLTACKYAYKVTDALPSELQADTIYFITEG